MPNISVLLLLIFSSFLLSSCWKENVPPADLITPDQDTAELYDPMNPEAYEEANPEDGLTPEDPLPEVKGNGTSLSSPAVITGVFTRMGKMEAESDFISEKLGKEGEDWKIKSTSVRNMGNKTCEEVTVETKGNTQSIFYFDITEYENSWQ
ncbi:hypothetical protein J5754_03360 [bacterium]|nr:hypothetical protein [bacterium]